MKWCLLLMLMAADAAAQGIRPAALRTGEVSFAMKATKVNDFTGRAQVTSATFGGTDVSNVTGTVQVRVADMRTGIGLRDTHMRNALQAGQFPTIDFRLVGVDPGPARGDTVPMTFQGPMTIHGVTHTVRVPGWAIVRPSGAEIHASFPIDMREYDIDPPSRFLGAVKVDPVTQVTVHLIFGP